MSDRARVRGQLANRSLGRHTWNHRRYPPDHTCPNAPDCGLPANRDEANEAVEEAYQQADETYVFVQDRVDWNRVLMLAASRHDQMRERHPDQHPEFGPDGELGWQGVCGDCLNQAVLLDGRGKYQWPEDMDTPSRKYEGEPYK